MNKRYKDLLNNTFIFAVGNLGSRIINFFLVPVYTNILTAEEFGSADLVITLAGLICPVLTLVVHEGVLRFGLSNDVKNKNSVISNASVVIFFALVILAVLSPFFGFYKAVSNWTIHLLLIAAFDMANQNLLVYAKVNKKNKLYSIASIIYTLIFTTLTIFLLAVLKMRIEGYLLANIFAMAIMFFILIITTGAIKSIRLKYIDKALLNKMLLYSAPLVINNLSWWLIHSTGKFAIEFFASVSLVGIFAIASKIPALQAVIVSIFQQAWTLSAINEFEEEKNTNFYTKTFMSYTTILVIMNCCILIILKPFMSVYVGAEFSDSWRSIPILLFGGLFNACSSYFGSIYIALKMNKQVALSTFFCAVCNVTLCFVLIPMYGVLGASVAMAASYIVIAVFRCFNSRKYFYFPISFGRCSINLLTILIQTLLTSMDFHIYLAGFTSLLILIFTNYRDLLSIANQLPNLFKRQ